MEIILAVATLVGGISALWYFWDKIKEYRQRKRKQATPQVGNLLKDSSWENIERIIMSSDPKNDWNSVSDNWVTIVSYKKDTNLRFEIRYEGDGIQAEDFVEPWANRFPDPHATGYWCNLYFGSTLVRKFVLVSVDGGRALLPLPRKLKKSRNFPDQVLPLDYKIAEIHDSLGTLRQYMKLAGLTLFKGT
ncbi:MAG: hypothetical protein HY257_04115 [Chloroflexi bacterium]|nr:hypothetical protein [Chloroflexota bacterium]